MKELQHSIVRASGSRCDSNEGNNVAKAYNERTGKLHQSSLVTNTIAVSISEKMKPAILLEETETSTTGAIRGIMMLRVRRRLRMNVGDPNSMGRPP